MLVAKGCGMGSKIGGRPLLVWNKWERGKPVSPFLSTTSVASDWKSTQAMLTLGARELVPWHRHKTLLSSDTEHSK